MNTLNLQLYNLFRHDLNLSDGKSLEFMNILDKEYKSGVKEDLATLEKKLNEQLLNVNARFENVDARFENVDARFENVDARFEKIDARFEQIDARFDKIDARFDKIDARFDKTGDRFTLQDERLAALDKKIDVKVGDLRTEILSAKNETNRYILGLFLAMLLAFIALFTKK